MGSLSIILPIMLIMSTITFILYFSDKQKAKAGAWRIRESTLILLSFLGGSVGAMLGMFLLRHKTKHIKFRILIPFSFILHLVLILLLVFK